MPFIKRKLKPADGTQPIATVPGPTLRRTAGDVRERLAKELGCEPLLQPGGGYDWLEEAQLNHTVVVDLTKELPRGLWAPLLAASSFKEDSKRTVTLFESHDEAYLRIIMDDEYGPFVQTSLGGKDLKGKTAVGLFFWDGRWNRVFEEWLKEHPDATPEVP